MGLYIPKHRLNQLFSDDPKKSAEAKEWILEYYNDYWDGMESGLFGLIFGRGLSAIYRNKNHKRSPKIEGACLPPYPERGKAPGLLQLTPTTPKGSTENGKIDG